MSNLRRNNALTLVRFAAVLSYTEVHTCGLVGLIHPYMYIYVYIYIHPDTPLYTLIYTLIWANTPLYTLIHPLIGQGHISKLSDWSGTRFCNDAVNQEELSVCIILRNHASIFEQF